MKKKYQFGKMSLVGLTAVMMTAVCAQAADLAMASEELAEIASMVVDAKFKLAQAANGGDVASAAQAAKSAQAADASWSEAMEAFAAMDRALSGGDRDAADAAYGDLQAAGEKVAAIVDSVGGSEGEGAGGEGQVAEQAGDRVINPNDVPWRTAGQRKVADDSYETGAQSTGGGTGTGVGEEDGGFGLGGIGAPESDATPE